MTRTFVNINDLASYNSLYNAFRKVSAGNKGERKDVKKYAENLSENLKRLSKELKQGTWIPDTGRTFKLFTEGKWRDIHTVSIEDRIVYQALNYHLGTHLRKTFIRRTNGSIKKRGTLRASKQVRNDIRSRFPYVIKIDLEKYYKNIVKSILKQLIRRKIKGEAVLRLNDKIIDSYLPEIDRGISIGALLSQDNGNYYLTCFDYFCQQTLKIKHYVRYVDDIVIMSENKQQAADWINNINEFLNVNLKATIGSLELFPIESRKIDFCGYQCDNNGVMLRRRVLKKFIRKLRKFTKQPPESLYERSCVCSYLGFLRHCNSYNILKQLRHEYSEVFNRIDRYAA